MRGPRIFAIVVVLSTLSLGSIAAASECDNPDANWLACEDFEGGAQGWDAWWQQSPWVECLGCRQGNTENPDRIMLDSSQAHDGDWSLYMPAAAAANYQGASLTWRSCQGEKKQGCTLTGHDQLYWRAWVRLAPDHQKVHHFMAIAGTQPDQYWGADGNAGCRPNGYRAAGTTLDFNEDHELHFYTYYPEMNCDSGGYCSGDYVQNICDGCAQKDMPCSDGPECCWGNFFETDPKPVLEKDKWVCLEMMMKINTPGESDGEMAFWVDGQLGHRETGMHWRDVPELQLNKVWVQHYLANGDADQPNRIWWDDIVISTDRIGCGMGGTSNGTNNQTGTNNQAGTNDPTGTTDGSGGNGDGSGGDGITDGVGGPNPPGPGDDPSGSKSVSGEGGCSCDTPGSASSMVALLLFVLVATRRRRHA